MRSFDLDCLLSIADKQVILDVVYNHTAESDDKHAYPLSLRPIDNKAYFLVGDNGDLMNFSGTFFFKIDFLCPPLLVG